MYLPYLSYNDYSLGNDFVANFAQFLLTYFTKSVSAVKMEMRPLLLPQLLYLVSLFVPAVHHITWTQPVWQNFVDDSSEAVKQFEILVSR